MPTAYSYIRFSSVEQSKGDSHRRQTDMSRTYAIRNGLELDEKLTFADLGTSAYRGKNATEGGLRLFLDAVDEGIIKAGSYLLIENFDRLSREPAVNALQTMMGITDRGINIVTLSDGRVYTKDNIQKDFVTLFTGVLQMARAHEESHMKGERVRAAWATKKQTDARAGKPITNMLPSWLTIRDSNFIVKKREAMVVQMVFNLATEEGLGQRAICTRLKNEKIPPIGYRSPIWTETSVRRILLNESVTGVYQPMTRDRDNPRIRRPEGDPIEEYYPIVVTRAQYRKAMLLRTESKIPRGPRGPKLGTIFTGILFCSCGATMRRKGASKNDIYDRLRCANTCGAKSWVYKELEDATIHCLAQVILPNLQNVKTDLTKLEDQLYEEKAKLDAAKKRSDNLVSAIENGQSMEILQERLEKVNQEIVQGRKNVEALQFQLKAAEDRRILRQWDYDAAHNLSQQLATMDREKMRDQLRYALSKAVDRIVLEKNEPSEKGKNLQKNTNAVTVSRDVCKTARIEIGKLKLYIDFNRDGDAELRSSPDLAPGIMPKPEPDDDDYVDLYELSQDI